MRGGGAAMVKKSNLIPGGAAKKIEGGKRVMIILPEDVHQYLKSKGGSKWLTKHLRLLMALE